MSGPIITAQPLSAATFLTGVGVDTHVPYTDGGYANVSNVITDLKYLGVTQVRDGITNGEYGSAPLSSYIAMAQAGIHFTFIVEDSTPATIAARLSLIDQVERAVPGSVIAIEGPNEINIQPVTFGGVSGLQGALNLQAYLYAQVKADPALSGVAVDYFTGYGGGGGVGPDPSKTPGLADYDNQHPYPNPGQGPGYWVNRGRALNNTTSPTAPAVYTETGYSTNTVDTTVQAKYTLDLLLDTAQQGIHETYLYDLLDGYAPGTPQGDDGFGLFDYTKAAKPVATALHNLTAILQDTGAQASGFIPSPLAYAMSGLPSTGNALVLEKSSGVYDVVVWAEPQIWSVTSNSEIPSPSSNVTMTFASAYGSIQVYDPLIGSTAIQTKTNSASVTVAIADHPVIISLSNPVTPLIPTVSFNSQILAADTGASATDNVTSNGSVTLTGLVAGAVGTTVKVLDGSSLLGAATVSSSGGWTYTTTLVAGSHSLKAVATDPSGHTATSAAGPAILVEAVPPSLTIVAPTVVFAATTATVTVRGAVGASATGVKIYNGSTALGAATLNGAGGWTFTQALQAGAYTFRAVATDLAGNTASAADAVFALPAATGIGSDTLALNVSETAVNGKDAQFIVQVDGVQVGNVQTATASRALGASQTIALHGNFGPGPHTVSVQLLDGFTGSAADAGRALFVNALTLDNSTTFTNGQQMFNGAVNYAVQAPSTPLASNVGSQDTLALNLSETAASGLDAQFMVSVDGQIVGGVQTVTAAHLAGASQTFTLTGNFGGGSHAIAIDFLNGFAGAPADAGRSLYVNAITLDGATSAENAQLLYNGSETFTVQAGSATAASVTGAATRSQTAAQIAGSPFSSGRNQTAGISLFGQYMAAGFSGESAAAGFGLRLDGAEGYRIFDHPIAAPATSGRLSKGLAG